MKLRAAIVVGLMSSTFNYQAIADGDNGGEAKLRKDAAEQHILAAEQLEESAAHHRKVAEFYKSGKMEDAGWNAYMAYAHSLRAQSHIENAAMLHLSEKRFATDKVAPAEPK